MSLQLEIRATVWEGTALCGIFEYGISVHTRIRLTYLSRAGVTSSLVRLSPVATQTGYVTHGDC